MNSVSGVSTNKIDLQAQEGSNGVVTFSPQTNGYKISVNANKASSFRAFLYKYLPRLNKLVGWLCRSATIHAKVGETNVYWVVKKEDLQKALTDFQKQEGKVGDAWVQKAIQNYAHARKAFLEIMKQPCVKYAQQEMTKKGTWNLLARCNWNTTGTVGLGTTKEGLIQSINSAKDLSQDGSLASVAENTDRDHSRLCHQLLFLLTASGANAGQSEISAKAVPKEELRKAAQYLLTAISEASPSVKDTVHNFFQQKKVIEIVETARKNEQVSPSSTQLTVSPPKSCFNEVLEQIEQLGLPNITKK